MYNIFPLLCIEMKTGYALQKPLYIHRLSMYVNSIQMFVHNTMFKTYKCENCVYPVKLSPYKKKEENRSNLQMLCTIVLIQHLIISVLGSFHFFLFGYFLFFLLISLLKYHFLLSPRKTTIIIKTTCELYKSMKTVQMQEDAGCLQNIARSHYLQRFLQFCFSALCTRGIRRRYCKSVHFNCFNWYSNQIVLRLSKYQLQLSIMQQFLNPLYLVAWWPNCFSTLKSVTTG